MTPIQTYHRAGLLQALDNTINTLKRYTREVEARRKRIADPEPDSVLTPFDNVNSIILDLTSNLPNNLNIEAIARHGAYLSWPKEEK